MGLLKFKNISLDNINKNTIYYNILFNTFLDIQEIWYNYFFEIIQFRNFLSFIETKTVPLIRMFTFPEYLHR